MATLATCFVTCAGLPEVVWLPSSTTSSGATISTSVPVGAQIAYATTHTNYFGATGCTMKSLVKPTPSSSGQPPNAVPCTLPASISGSKYQITPVVYVPNSSAPKYHTCDPVAASVANAQNFRFVCSTLAGKDLNNGQNTLLWNTPRGAPISMATRRLMKGPLSSTPLYILNPAKATTTTTPTTYKYITSTWNSTYTQPTKTDMIRITTATVTTFCTATTTVTVSGRPGNITARHEDWAQEPSLTVLPFDEYQIPDASFVDSNIPESELEIREVEAPPELPMRIKRAPTLGKPDAIYPPYANNTIFVSSIHTSTITLTDTKRFTLTASPGTVTRTTSVALITQEIITVTKTVTKA